MGNLRDELSKMFPEANDRFEQAKDDAKTRRKNKTKADDWKAGVQPLKKGQGKAPDTGKCIQQLRSNGLGMQSQNQRKDTRTNNPNLIKQVADYNARLDAIYGQSKKDKTSLSTSQRNP